MILRYPIYLLNKLIIFIDACNAINRKNYINMLYSIHCKSSYNYVLFKEFVMKNNIYFTFEEIATCIDILRSNNLEDIIILLREEQLKYLLD